MNRKRVALIDRLEQSGKDYLWYLGQLTEDEIRTPPAPNEWSIHQVVAHMRDTERQVFLLRAERIVQEDHPTVPSFDQEAWTREHYSATEPFKAMVVEFRNARRKLVRLLRASTERDWKNWAAHPQFGKISLEWLVLHNYHHTLEHISQIGNLREKAILKRLNSQV